MPRGARGLGPPGVSTCHVRIGALALVLGGCALAPIDLAGRSCPCIEGWVCDALRDECVPSSIDGPDGGCGGGTECGGFVPSNVAGAVSFSDSSIVLAIPDGEVWVIDSDDGSIDASSDAETREVRAPGVGMIDGIRYEQVPSGDPSVPDHGVFVIGGLRVAPMARLVAARGRARSLVLVAAGDVIIDGLVKASAADDGPGPGGGEGGATGAEDGSPGAGGSSGGGRGGESGRNGEDGGGGGGGLGSAGAPGGAAGGGGSAAGGASRCTESLAPLCAGAGGGAGGDNDGGRGGHGGGGLQITSVSSIVVRGLVEASGEGGRGGRAVRGRTDTGAGGGGGSGGAILLEATTVTIHGTVSALGGAGGQGARCDDCSSSGVDGATYDSASAPPAPGSSSSGTGGGGGAGADAMGDAQLGLAGENGGGGGGGAGRIRIHTMGGVEIDVDARLYPMIASGLTTVAAGTLGPH